MKNKINWNPKNRAILQQMWDEEKTDAEITEYFGCGAFAVGKQRSILGLTKFKKRKGLHHIPKQIPVYDANFNVLKYSVGGQTHYGRILPGKDNAKMVASRVLDRNMAIQSVMVLKPVMVVTRTQVKEYI